MNRYVYFLLLSFLASLESGAANTGRVAKTPRLVVNIAIDQLRADLLEEYMPLLSNDGFRKLMHEGRVYKNASMPFLPVDCASAIASISTGSYPLYNGIPSKEWVSRKTSRPMFCTADQVSLLTPRNATPTPINIMSSTLSDELKIHTDGLGKVYNIATGADAAILFAGYTSDCAMWIDVHTGLWTTSTYYNELQPEWLNVYNSAYSASRKLKSRIYSFKGREKYLSYTTTSLVNEDVTSVVLNCVSSERLGMDNIPDLVNIQYSAANVREDVKCTVTDILQYKYIELDKSIGKLISTIEQNIGKDNVLFVVTSTGYYDDVAVDYGKYRIPSGTVYINRTSSLLNMFLSALYGNAHYVDAYKDNQIYLNRKLIEQRRLPLNEVLERSREMLLMSDGISDVYTSFMLTKASDKETQLLRNGYNLDVCGDLVIEVAPGWNIYDENTKKYRERRQYGFVFPVILYGTDFRHEIIEEPVTTDQIAPTISKKIKIRAPNASKSKSLK